MEDVLPTLDGYKQRLTGAHRKPAARVGVPALVCHLAIWKPLNFRDANGASKNNTGAEREARSDLIDEYLALLYKKLNEISDADEYRDFSTPSEVQSISGKKYVVLFNRLIDKNSGEFLSKNDPDITGVSRASEFQTIAYRVFWHNLEVTIRFELHTEYFTISTYIDLSGALSLREIDQNIKAEERKYVAEHRIFTRVVTAFQLFFKNVEADIEAQKISGYSTDTFRTLNEAVHKELYHSLWEDFFKCVLSTNDFEKYGLVFADFRGIVLGCGEDGEAFQTPFYRDRGKPPGVHHEKPDKSWLNSQVKRFWAFLTSDHNVLLKSFEFTVSGMLGGRALYATALGAQPADLPVVGRFPLMYFISTKNRSRWQTGRLIDRIHDLGTVRLAALMKLDKLRDAGALLRDVEEKIVSARSAVQKMSSESAADAPVGKHVKELSTNLSEIQLVFSKIDKLGDDAEIGQNTIEYRLDRARYYIRQFHTGLAALRVKRVEGFQPYDQFVERRLGSAFDFIARLSARLARVESETEALFQYYLAQSATGVAIGINRSSDRIERLNESLLNMQGLAEVALFFALIPYYFLGFLDHIFAGLDVGEGTPLNRWFGVFILFACWPIALGSMREIFNTGVLSQRWIAGVKEIPNLFGLKAVVTAATAIMGFLFYALYQLAIRGHFP